ncbi:MAG: threonine synthase [Desulfurococcaceae archaeon]
MYRIIKPGIVLKCIKCGKTYTPAPRLFLCPKCNHPLEVVLENTDFDWNKARRRRLCVWRYRELLPIREGIDPVSLNEGGTPLIKISNLYEKRVVESPYIYIKFEGANPTGSFKDRGMTIGVTIAKHLGVEGVVVASTGNTSASAAAYAARAGLRCIVFLPKGGVARGKIAQALLHGAEIREVDGSFDKALEEVLMDVLRGELANYYPLNSYNPWRLEGQKTIAFEIVDELGFVPDYVIVPAGNTGNISAIWKGFKELCEFGFIDKLPHMIGVQSENSAPLVKTWLSGSNDLIPVKEPKTIASAIRIGRPVNWLKALKAIIESKGFFETVSDDEIINSMKLLARYEGIGVEPASATTLACLIKCMNKGIVKKDDNVVLVATGHALKDPDVIIKNLESYL